MEFWLIKCGKRFISESYIGYFGPRGLEISFMTFPRLCLASCLDVYSDVISKWSKGQIKDPKNRQFSKSCGNYTSIIRSSPKTAPIWDHQTILLKTWQEIQKLRKDHGPHCATVGVGRKLWVLSGRKDEQMEVWLILAILHMVPCHQQFGSASGISQGISSGPAAGDHSQYLCVFMYINTYIYVYIYVCVYLFTYNFHICIYSSNSENNSSNNHKLSAFSLPNDPLYWCDIAAAVIWETDCHSDLVKDDGW